MQKITKIITKPENIFLILCLLWGLIFLCVNTPFQSPDEPEHMLKMWGYTQKTLHYQVKDVQTGLKLPQSPAYLYNFYNVYRLSNNKIPYKSTIQTLEVPLTKETTTFLPHTPSIYTPLSYFPSFIVLWLLKLLNIKPLLMLYILRFCSLLVYLALCYTAIKITPCFKWSFWLFSLLPVNIYQAASVSVDGLTFGLMILFFAYTLKLAFDDNVKDINLKQILLWGIMFVYICQYVG